MQMFKAREKVDDEEVKEAFERMYKQIQEKGGGFHFSMKVDDEGWFAECQEFPSIVAGSSNKNPTKEEVFHSIIEAIKIAFDIPITTSEKVDEESSVKIKLEQEFTFPNYL